MKAVDGYIEAQAIIAEKLADLQAAVQEHMDRVNPENVNWGHVGDLNHIMAAATELAASTHRYQAAHEALKAITAMIDEENGRI